jgi:integrase
VDKKPGRAGIKARHKNSIEIQFQYRGMRRRETIKIAPTPANLKYAAGLRAMILTEIAKGTFDYLQHFPDSRHALALSPKPANGMTVGLLLDEWITTITATVEPETLADYAEYVRNIWKPVFGELPLLDLTLDMADKWVIAQACGAKRIKNLLTPLRQALRFAVPKYLPIDPLAGIKVKRVRSVAKEKVIDPFSREEVKAVLLHLEPSVANMMEFWAWTGLREGELIALKWSDIDEKRGVIRVDRASRAGRIKATKTETGFREVTLLRPALDALDRQKRHTRLLHREIFLTPGTRACHRLKDGAIHYGELKPTTINNPWTDEKAISRRWAKACKAAGVRYRFPRQMRHTYASWMLNDGETPIWVSGQMGHANLMQTLKAYTRFIPNNNPNAGMKAVAAWNAFLAEQAKAENGGRTVAKQGVKQGTVGPPSEKN